MKKIILALLSGAFIASCNLPDEGFFSAEGIKMREDTVDVVSGLFQLTAIPEIDGSTRPLSFQLDKIRDLRTGEIVDLPTFNIRMWKSTFNPDQDSTMDQVNEKLEIRNVPPLEVNQRSGQIAFNAGTVNMTSDLYGVDVHASNPTSSKLFENFCIFRLVKKPFEQDKDFGDSLNGIPDDGEKGRVGLTPETATFSAAALEQVRNNTHPNRKLTKVKDSDIVKLTMVVRDAEGKPFKGKDITFWPNPNAGGSYFPNFHDNSIAPEGSTEKVHYTDTSCVFTFPTVPYPTYARVSGASPYLTYYCISWNACNLSPQGQSIVDAYLAKNPNTKFTQYSARIRNGYKINEPGEWLLEIKSPYVLRKN